MQRYFIYLAYDGTAYHGWQVQPNGNSVQAELQNALSILLRYPVEVIGAGRTDAGVHARMMVAHFDLDAPVNEAQLTYKLNRLLPKDISVDKVAAVDSSMLARFSAVSRTYHYYGHARKDPFKRTISCFVHYDLDFETMNEAALYLLQVENFGAFCKTHNDSKTTLCRVARALWVQDNAYSWHFVITANRFLRNMVRAVVGTLIDVGRHRIDKEEFIKIVEGCNRTDAGESMPAHALFLENIEY